MRSAGKVTFPAPESLGDVTLGWDKIKELHTSGKVGVLEQNFGGGKGKQAFAKIPTGTIDVSDGKLDNGLQKARPPRFRLRKCSL